MIRRVMFVAGLLFLAAPTFGQVPPGLPYDAARNPNPIITYVTNPDFKTSTYADAHELSDIELLGLSQDQGKRESIEVARTAMKKVRIGSQEANVTFYPVVRQTFRLSNGERFVIHSFKFPKVPIPPRIAEQILNEAAFAKTRKPADARFGLAAPPEMMDIRGFDALLFDNDGELTLFWVENGVGHTATAKIPRKDLFELVEDLL